MGISDKAFFEQILPIIATQKQPFFSFVFTLSSHSPFELPDKYKELKLDGKLGQSKLGGYYQCIRYSDKQIGMLLDQLKARGCWNNTLVTITGDHEGVHKYFKNEIDAIKQRDEWWLDNNKKLPLIIYNKDIKPKEIKITGGQVDIMPTLAYLMGINDEDYENTAMGRNLFSGVRNLQI